MRGARKPSPRTETTANGDEREVQVLLGILTAIERNCEVTQRSLSRDLGIALGLTNLYIRRCVKKGLVKIRRAPLNRYAYYLTPTGFAEKSVLTGRYLSHSFWLFRSARADCGLLFQHAKAQGWSRILILGRSDVTEIAILSAVDSRISVVGVMDEVGPMGGTLVGVPVVGAPTEPFDALMLADLDRPTAAFHRGLELLRDAGLDESRLLVPSLISDLTATARPLAEEN